MFSLMKAAGRAFPALAKEIAPVSRKVPQFSTSADKSIWDGIDYGPLDPIFHYGNLYNEDAHHMKQFFVYGVYRTQDGKPHVFPVVRKIEEELMDKHLDKEYPPIPGNPAFLSGCKKLVMGADSPHLEKTCSIQGISGLGSVRLGLEYISQLVGKRPFYCPSENYPITDVVIKHMGFPFNHYPSFDFETKTYDTKGTVKTILEAPKGSVIEMQPCATNPTGADPSKEDWVKIMEAIKERDHFTFFDFAYQGFATGDLDDDAYPIRLFADNGLEMLIAESYAKKAGMYGERVGALHIVTKTPQLAQQLHSHSQNIYGMDPIHGTRVIERLLNDPKHFADWKVQLKEVVKNINTSRSLLLKHLEAINIKGNWKHIIKHNGLFTYTCLNKQQCDLLMKEHHIYLVPIGGRMNITCLNPGNVEYVANAIKHVVDAIPNPNIQQLINISRLFQTNT